MALTDWTSSPPLYENDFEFEMLGRFHPQRFRNQAVRRRREARSKGRSGSVSVHLPCGRVRRAARWITLRRSVCRLSKTTSPYVSSSPLGTRAVRCAGVRDRGCARASTPAATSRWRSADDTGGRPSARLLHVAKDVFLIAAPFMIGGRAACSEALVGDDDLVLLLAAGGVGRNRSSCTGSLSCCRSRLCMKMRRALRLQLLSFQLSSKESQPSRPGMACHLRRAVGVMHIAAAVQHIKHLPRLRGGAGDCEWSLLELSPMAAFCLSGFVALQPHSCPGRRPPPAPATPRFSRFL
jgi:hypothetical protein